MKIGIIVEGNEVIGLGHLIRCKIIAKHLESKKTNAILFLPDSTDNSLVEGFNTCLIPTSIWSNIYNNQDYIYEILNNFDCILIDLIEKKYIEFSFLKESSIFIISLSLFEFKSNNYFGDIVFFPSMTKSERQIGKTKIFSGPQFFIIDDNLKKSKKRNNGFNSEPTLLITMGGADPANITEKIISSTDSFNFKFNAIVIAGKANINKDHIRLLVEKRDNFRYLEFTNDIENVYSQIDFAIINGGNTRYELTRLQIPYACISLHEVQNTINESVTNLYGGLNLGIYSEITELYISNKINKFFSSPVKIEYIKEKMKAFKGGDGHIIIANTFIQKDYVNDEND